MGAARAASITFVADGGIWIWDRIPTIIRLATKSWTVYHASHHISLALAAMGLNDKERMPLYRQHRTLLRNGQWRRVVQELSEIAQGDPENPCSGVVQSIGRTGCQATPPSQDRRPLRLDVGAAEDECQR
jgi:hypothetical protein